MEFLGYRREDGRSGVRNHPEQHKRKLAPDGNCRHNLQRWSATFQAHYASADKHGEQGDFQTS